MQTGAGKYNGSKGSVSKAFGAVQRLSGLDLGLLWFSAAICVTEIWAGGLPALTSLGLGLGLLAILGGRAIGNGLMAAMAAIGAQTGQPTMLLTRPVLGLRGSWIPAGLNVLQLVGWTGWMLFVCAAYLDVLAGLCGLPRMAATPGLPALYVLLLALCCTGWALLFGPSRAYQIIDRVSGILLVLLTIGMSVVLLQHFDPAAHAPAVGAGWHGLLSGMDLVVAMSVSWLPLVADYSRYATSRRAAANGTFWGYLTGGTWMYAVGLLVALASGSDTPDALVVETLGRQGALWLGLAALLVLVSTVTTTFLDIYSAAVSTRSLLPRLPEKPLMLACGGLGALLALLLDVNMYQPFLLAIGLVFLPVFTVVLADYYLLGHRSIDSAALETREGLYWYSGGFNWRALTACLLGALAFDACGGWASLNYFLGLLQIPLLHSPALPTGSSLPCIAVSALAYIALEKLGGSNARATMAVRPLQ